MNYRYTIFIVFSFSAFNALEQDPRFDVDRLQKSDQIFDALQMYGRTAGQVASTVVAVMGQHSNTQAQTTGKLSSNDKGNIVNIVVTSFLLLVEFARYCHAKQLIKQRVRNMTHDEFVDQYPHLAVVEYQILLMKKLIDLTVEGTFDQQIFARIQLPKMSLPYPYEKVAQKAAKKMQKACFDSQGNFIWTELSMNKHPYKKFLKKVSQGWQDLVFKAHKIEGLIQPEYGSKVAVLVETPYNNALILMIQAGMHKDFDQMKKLAEQYADKPVVANLLNYYLSCC